MSLTAILRSIERDSTAAAEAALAEARADAGRIRTEAEDAANRRVAAALAAAEPGLRAEAARIVNAARLAVLRQRAEQAAARSERAWELARRTIDDLAEAGDPRWREALVRLATESLAMAGSGAIVTLRARDASLVRAAVEAGGGRVVVGPGDMPPGALVRSADGRLEVDATVPMRLERARSLPRAAD